MLFDGSIDMDRYKKEGDEFRVHFAFGGVARAGKLPCQGFFFSTNSALDIGFFVTKQL